MNLAGEAEFGRASQNRAVAHEVRRADWEKVAGGWYLSVKTAAELLFALLLLAVTAPLILLGMALVKLTSRGPGLYLQTRVGRGGRPFTIYKLRTMSRDSESLTGACWSTPGDTRITRVGRWLRRTHIDELPQLWNILRGDMSLIGPRPERPEFVPQLELAVPLYALRLNVRPGVTGLAQVQLPPDTDLESVRLKLAYDLYYLQHASWWLDFRIHLATGFHMLGVPFSLIRKIFAFAEQQTIEEEYESLAASTVRVGQNETVNVNETVNLNGHARVQAVPDLQHDKAG
jgi:lipopolysaccharide/colanic/teichoic acid biosynthesis glycosyltransferase